MKLLRLADRGISVLGLLLFGVLTGFSLFYTVYYTTEYQEIPYEKQDLFLVVLLVCAGLLFLMQGVSVWILKREEGQERRIRILLGVILAYVLLFGVWWIFNAHCVPAGDQASVCKAAAGFRNGDYSMLTKSSYERYLFIHPHQLGLTALVELFYGIFGNGNNQAFELFNCLGAAVCVYSGYRITRLLTESRRAWIYYLFLAAGCFPLFFYVTFVYGEIPSLTYMLLAVWLFLEYRAGERKREAVSEHGERSHSLSKWVCLAGCCAAISLACLIRNNSVIVLVAMVLILGAEGLEKRQGKPILLAAVLITSMLASRFALHTVYEKRAGIELNAGAPMILYVAMGMQEGGGAPGWSNGYILHAYWGEADFDAETAAALAKQDIRHSLEKFAADPFYAGDFYLKKFTSQWNDPTYQCFAMTHINDAPRGSIVNSMYDGKLQTIMTWFMNQYQSLIFIGVFVWLLFGFWRKKDLESQLLVLVIFGGFLFHMLWEAKGRYSLPYFVMMLPMAAAGLEELGRRLEAYIRK